MSFLRSFADLLLYSSLWIGLCAVAQAIYTFELLMPGSTFDTSYLYFLFCGTVAIYSLHHLVGLRRYNTDIFNRRWAFIRRHTYAIAVIALITTVATMYFFSTLRLSVYAGLLVAPVIIALAYVLPVFKGGTRVRDIGSPKILLVALVWSWMVTAVPLFVGSVVDWHVFAFAMSERFFFLLAATMTFEIRDIEFDKRHRTKSVARTFGIRQTRILSMVCLCFSACLNLMAMYLGYFPPQLAFPYSIFFALTACLIAFARPGLSDHYFSGLVDGSMMVLPMLYFILA